MATENQEKRELLKLKQGLIEDSEIIEVDKPHEKEELKGLAKLGNFWYHNKWYIIVAVFFIAVGSFLTYQLLAKEAADMRVLLVTSNVENTPELYRKTMDIELALEQYCPDFDKNGNVHVEVYYIDLTKDTPDSYYITVNNAKFFGEIDSGIAQMIICDTNIYTDPELSDAENKERFNSLFTDLAEVTGNESLSGTYTVKFKDTPLAAAANYENSAPEILVMGVKKESPNMISYSDKALEKNSQAREVMQNILNNNVINEKKQ